MILKHYTIIRILGQGIFFFLIFYLVEIRIKPYYYFIYLINNEIYQFLLNYFIIICHYLRPLNLFCKFLKISIIIVY